MLRTLSPSEPCSAKPLPKLLYRVSAVRWLITVTGITLNPVKLKKQSEAWLTCWTSSIPLTASVLKAESGNEDEDSDINEGKVTDVVKKNSLVVEIHPRFLKALQVVQLSCWNTLLVRWALVTGTMWFWSWLWRLEELFILLRTQSDVGVCPTSLEVFYELWDFTMFNHIPHGVFLGFVFGVWCIWPRLSKPFTTISRVCFALLAINHYQ